MCGGQDFLLESLEEACMCLSPLREGGWVARPSLEGRQVAILRLHVVPLSNNYCIMSCILPLWDSVHEGKTRGRIVR